MSELTELERLEKAVEDAKAAFSDAEATAAAYADAYAAYDAAYDADAAYAALVKARIELEEYLKEHDNE